MELTLKTISASGIAEANSKAERYRFLNQPQEAESICLDVLAADAENQLALRNLGLAITDQFSGHPSDRYAEAERAFSQLTDPYEKLYYTGIMWERRGKSQLRAGRSPHSLLVIFRQAMQLFEQAAAVRPPNNDDALLHWNSCARVLMGRPEEEWEPQSEHAQAFEAGDGPM